MIKTITFFIERGKHLTRRPKGSYGKRLKSGRYKCGKCVKMFAEPSMLRRHYLTEHEDIGIFYKILYSFFFLML